MDVLSSAGLTIIGIILLDNSVYFARQMKIDSPGLLEKKKKKKQNTFLSPAVYFFHLQP